VIFFERDKVISGILAELALHFPDSKLFVRRKNQDIIGTSSGISKIYLLKIK